ncbi:MAG: glycosyltransferase [Gaiellaceae bacterium]|nr:glycosyltransferase [Gaiellaceae bacterium]
MTNAAHPAKPQAHGYPVLADHEARARPRPEIASVDVGVPTLGTSPYIVEAIESVFAQTVGSWTLTVSENGPGDARLRQQLEPYLLDARVRHLVTGERVSVGANHTRLLRVGEAPYVAILHDDDRWGPSFLERSIAFLEQHPSCAYVFSGHLLIDERGRVVGRSPLPLKPGVHSASDVLPRLYERNFIAPPTVVVRRDAYAALGAAYKEILFCDHEMWLRLLTQGDVGCLEMWEAEYRLHPLQTSSRKRLEFAERQFEVIEATWDLPIPSRVRRRALAMAHARCALDLVELAEGRRALGHVRRALTSDPFASLRPSVAARIAAALGALALGHRGRETLARQRLRRYHTRGSKPVP